MENGCLVVMAIMGMNLQVLKIRKTSHISNSMAW